MSSHRYARWNRSSSSSERSQASDDASNRIYDGFFTPGNLEGARRFSRQDPFFSMGSCFAREIEHALRGRGFRILSVDLDLLDRSGFHDEKGQVRTGFFHRFNLPAMEQELARAFDEIPFAEDQALLVEHKGHRYEDMNYFPCLVDLDLEGTVARRKVAKDLVRQAARSRLIVLTLGLVEAWFHKPSGLYCNSVGPVALSRHPDDFELRVVGYDENLARLESIYRCLERHHETKDFTLFVTVSPVPLGMTFTAQDVVVANARSKSTLRAVAEEFCLKHPNTVYFPSYEIAMYSRPDLVWRPDRIHVKPECVAHIVDTFCRNHLEAP